LDVALEMEKNNRGQRSGSFRDEKKKLGIGKGERDTEGERERERKTVLEGTVREKKGNTVRL